MSEASLLPVLPESSSSEAAAAAAAGGGGDGAASGGAGASVGQVLLPAKSVQLMDRIGAGAFGEVFKGR